MRRDAQRMPLVLVADAPEAQDIAGRTANAWDFASWPANVEHRRPHIAYLKTHPAPEQMPSARCGRNRGILQGADDFPWRGFCIKDKCLYILDVGFNVMNAPLPDGSPTVLPVLLQNMADAICDRPAESVAQRASRRREIVDLVNGLQPNDAVEMMLVSMVIAHAHLLEDATCDVFRGRDERVKAQTKSQVVALGRGVLGFLKELRTLQDRRRKAEAATQSARGVASADAGAVVPPEKASVPVARPVTRDERTNMPAGATPPEPVLPSRRSTETSVAAMMAALSQAVPSAVMSAVSPRGENSSLPSNNRQRETDTAGDRAKAQAA
jgi:hypothetical protein